MAEGSFMDVDASRWWGKISESRMVPASLAAAVAFAAMVAAFSASSPTQVANAACPSDASGSFGKSYEHLRAACLGGAIRASRSSPVLSCGSLRMLATRTDDEAWPEGPAADAAFRENCGLIGDGEAPLASRAYGPEMDGAWEGVAEFGSDDPQCGGEAPVTASVKDGRIAFRAAGREWKGFVTSNLWIAASPDAEISGGHEGSAIGPVSKAEIFDRRCGAGSVSFLLP